MVDRGHQNKEVLEFVYNLYKNNQAVLILGNHDGFLLNFFNGDFSRTRFDFLRNGHDKTIEQLIGREVLESDEFDEIRSELLKNYSHIYNMLKNAPLYYELGDYIFVHGGVNGSLIDWKQDTARNYLWNYQHLLKSVDGKTIVCGHTQNILIRKPDDYKEYIKHPEKYPELFDILYRDGVIHIDGSVVTTKRINVLVIEL
jgi:serine/threonine protein phosphatase 1